MIKNCQLGLFWDLSPNISYCKWQPGYGALVKWQPGYGAWVKWQPGYGAWVKWLGVRACDGWKYHSARNFC